MTHIVYNRHYNIKAGSLERFHPFDSRKYGRAAAILDRAFGGSLKVASPSGPISKDDLLTVHTEAYLARLKKSGYLAEALEVPMVGALPAVFIDRVVLGPMRWGCAGTLLAGTLALEHGLAVNLSGGYHHARPEEGEGFCVYADIALLVHHLRASSLIEKDSIIAYVDLDAHQGNGVCHCFMDDRAMVIFDMFNRSIYPAYDTAARERVDSAVPLERGTDDATYLGLLTGRLPEFLDRASELGPVSLMIYNAGTDILEGDDLGGLNVSVEGIVERDLYVAEQARDRDIPMVMLLSGGYTQVSHAVIAESVERILREHERADVVE